MLTREFFLFNTPNSISASDVSEDDLDSIESLCRRFELLFSRFNPESELYQLNKHAGTPYTVSPELSWLIQEALRYCNETNGLFDITMGSVTRLWDFHNETIPSFTLLEKALKHVNYRNITVEENIVTIHDPQACIDLGGIAKGYIADCILKELKEKGSKHSLVNLGGNVAVQGGKPDGSLWNIGLREPSPSYTMPVMRYFAVAKLDSASAVTSGTYERMFTIGNKTYHHILDPKNGMPVDTDCISATVFSARSIDGDGYTTALIAMGCDKALEFADKHPDIEVVLISSEGDILATPGVGTSIPFSLVH